MTGTAKRRPAILDVMALVAFSAGVLAAIRFSIAAIGSSPGAWGSTALDLAFWVILVTTLCLIPVPLCYPRPPLGRLGRRPGWLACIAVALTLAISFIQQLLVLGPILARSTEARPLQIVTVPLTEALHSLPHQAVFAVAAAWATLALVSVWEPDRGWIDRAGRILGIYWIGHAVLEWIVLRLPVW